MVKILVVDDSSLTRKTLRKIIEPCGHDVVEASNGLAAIELYREDKPAMVFLDMVMTGMSGMEVLHRLREIDNQARIVIASADIQTTTRAMTITAGAQGYINKPFVIDQVKSIIREVLAGKYNGA
jgi:two-component system, chemotaxis family, chemotaxis protein CheY